MSLNERAVLVSLNISAWSARKLDKKVTSDVAHQHATASSVGNYHKKLLPDSDSLQAISKHDGAIRTHFLTNTLPWGLKGVHLLPSANFMDYMSEFRQLRVERERLVAQFVREYPTLRILAQNTLKAMFNMDDYPSPHAIADKFSLDLPISPVPENDFRVQLSSDELDAMRNDLELRVKQASEAAMQEVWERLYTRVSNMVDRLSDPEAKFHNSLVENIRDLCELLPKLNFSDDPNLEAMRQQVERELAAYDPDMLRHNLTVREKTANEAANILKRMGVFMGQAS